MTVAFAVRGVFAWRWVPVYVAAQLAGAIGAAIVLRLVLSPGGQGHEGTTQAGGSLAQSFWLEVVLTALLVTVILNAATEHRLLEPDAALPTGATIAAGGLVGIAVSGASMNPARSLGPAIVARIGDGQWIYVVGPLLGALIGVGITAVTHGRPSHDETDAAMGDRNRPGLSSH